MSADSLAPLLDLPGVSAAVASARTAVDRLLQHRVLRLRSAEVSAESALRGAWAAAVLSGVDTTLEDVRAGAVDDPVVQGALRVSAALGPIADTWTPAPRQAMARLHLLAAADLLDATALGRPRPDRVVAARLDLLADTLAATRVPAVVVAAVVVGEILTLDAFAPSSVVVAHAAGRLVLATRGLDPRSLCVIEVGALELRHEHSAALAGFAGGTGSGLATWIGYVARMVELGAREATAICQARQRG